MGEAVPPPHTVLNKEDDWTCQQHCAPGDGAARGIMCSSTVHGVSLGPPLVLSPEPSQTWRSDQHRKCELAVLRPEPVAPGKAGTS